MTVHHDLSSQDIGPDITQIDWVRGDPCSLSVFHGTTHDFEQFDASVHGNPEGAFGSVHYFTSLFEDAERNYACEGPDLLARIDHKADRIASEMAGNPEEFSLDDDADFYAEARLIARSELAGTSHRVLACKVKLARPFVVDGRPEVHKRGARPRTPLLFPGHDEDMIEAENAVMRSHGIDLNADDLDDRREELEEEIYDRIDAVREALYERIKSAFDDAALGLEIPSVDLPSGLFDDIEDMRHDRFYEILKSDENLSYIDGVDGDMVASDFIARVIESLGFDGIVLLSADQKFPGMSIPMNAIHVHVFDACRDQIAVMDVIPMHDNFAAAA